MFERDSITTERSHAVNPAALPLPAVSDLAQLATCLQEFSTRRRTAVECCVQLTAYLGASAVALIRHAGDPAQDHVVSCSPAMIPDEARLIADSRRHTAGLIAGGAPLLIASDLSGDCLMAVLIENRHGHHVLAVTGSRDRPALETILPLLRAAFLARERIDRCYHRLALTGALLQRAENGLIMLDHLGCILYCNPAAETLLAAKSGMNVYAERLFIESDMAQAALAQLLVALRNRHLPDSVTVHLPREKRQPLTLILSPVLMEPSGPLFAPRRGVMVVLHDPEARHVLATEHCRSTYDLTPSESRVLQEFCRNPQLPAIGAALGVSPHTVKTHIVHICHKLGVHSRIELQRWLQTHPWPADPIVIDYYPEFAAERWNEVG